VSIFECIYLDIEDAYILVCMCAKQISKCLLEMALLLTDVVAFSLTGKHFILFFVDLSYTSFSVGDMGKMSRKHEYMFFTHDVQHLNREAQ